MRTKIISMGFNSMLRTLGNNGRTKNIQCPKCSIPFMRISADLQKVRIYCSACFWEINYMVINKNEK